MAKCKTKQKVIFEPVSVGRPSPNKMYENVKEYFTINRKNQRILENAKEFRRKYTEAQYNLLSGTLVYNTSA